MPSSQAPSALSATQIWFFGLSVSALWGLILLFFAYRSGAAATAGALGLGVTLGWTWRLSRIAGRAEDHRGPLEHQLAILQLKLNRLLTTVPRGDEPHAAEGSLLATPSSLVDSEPLSPQMLEQVALACDRAYAAVSESTAVRAQQLAVLQNLDSGLIVIDPGGRVSLVNPAAVRFFSIPGKPVGRPLVEAVRQPQLLDAVAEVTADRSPREVIVEVLDEAATRRVLRVLCMAIGQQPQSSVLLAARDETENRLTEEIRREFVANVSHELKTPLAAIKGYAETVELAISDDREAALHFISQIHEQCRRLERLIADMMTLARAQAGAQQLHLATVDLASVIAESIATYAPVAGAKSIELQCSAESTPPVLLYGDREAILTIANNVIGNAIRYTPEGGKVIVEARREGACGVLVVRDNGIGIPEHEQKRVFERFYRAEKSRHDSNHGTGLGLAIVKNLTHAQGGRVQLQSRPGRGSTFEIYLPLS